jgi:hypothetical protein
MATTAFCTSAKVELLKAGHNFTATKTPTCNTTNTSINVTSVSALTGLQPGMPVSGTGIAANTVIARFTSSTALDLSIAATATNTGITLTATADVFKILLIKTGPTRTFDGTQTNVGTPGTSAPTATNVGTDEVTGTGYTSGGFTLTNVDPSNPSGATAIATFSVNPSWSSASFSTTAGVIYNNSARLENASGRSISVHDFGGTQTVTAGTFTLTIPTADASNALLRLS